LKEGLFEVDSDMTEGQTNDFLRDIAAVAFLSGLFSLLSSTVVAGDPFQAAKQRCKLFSLILL
jgi:hypothetical protein